MQDGVGHAAELPHLDVKNNDDSSQFWCQRAEEIQTLLVLSGVRNSLVSPLARDENGQLHAVFFFKKKMTCVGSETTPLALVELESTPLDHSGCAIDGESSNNLRSKLKLTSLLP